jgi:acyl-coenzyme A synthetase/AMP-(fatty) acid ligase
MVPETITFQSSLPKTSTGKIDRTRLAAEMEA